MLEVLVICTFCFIAYGIYWLASEPPKPEPEPIPEPEQPEPTEPPPPFLINKVTGLRLTKRNEHMFIVAKTGHGKSELLKSFLIDDIEAANRGECSVVVVESQGTLIRDILKAHEACTERTVLIDPHDVEHPFNLSFLNVQRINSLPTLQRETAIAGALEMLAYLMADDMTDKQQTLFTYVFELMLHVPDATIHTLLDILSKGGSTRYAQYIAKLDHYAGQFFADSDSGFDSREFRDTKSEVQRRLYGLLSKRYISAMFSDPQPRFQWEEALEQGSLVLVNTSEDLLQSHMQTYGRFIISQVLQAVQQRLNQPGPHKPVYLYLDEAADYFDETTEKILAKARKLNLGMIVAFQNLEQVERSVLASMLANTHTKIAGRISNSDAKRLLSDFHLGTEHLDFMTDVPRGVFNAYCDIPLSHEIGRNGSQWPTARSIGEPWFYSEYGTLFSWYEHRFARTNNVIGQFKNLMTPSTAAERHAIIDRMRREYSVQPTTPPPKSEPEPEPPPDDDPTVAKKRTRRGKRGGA